MIGEGAATSLMSDEGKPSFRRKLSEIPCLRSTFLFSISSGIVAGLGHFLFTSKVNRSYNVAIGTYMITTVGYWIYCRYHYAYEKFKVDQMTEAIRSRRH